MDLFIIDMEKAELGLWLGMKKRMHYSYHINIHF